MTELASATCASTQKSAALINRGQQRNALIGISVLLLLMTTGSNETLSVLTRRGLVGILQCVGQDVVSSSEQLTVSGIQVPWQKDCSGLNLVTLLLAAAAWTRRREPSLLRFLTSLSLAILTGYVVNLLRVLTIIGYRGLWYPLHETMEAHYAIGFFWLIPSILLFVPRHESGIFDRWIQAMAISVIVCLLSPHLSLSHGWLAGICTTVIACSSYTDHGTSKRTTAIMVLWLISGIGLQLLRVDSFWVAWLLLCPLTSSFFRRANWSRWMCLAGTVPVVSLHFAGWILVAPGVIRELYAMFTASRRGSTAETAIPHLKLYRVCSLANALALIGMMLPFCSHIIRGPVAHPELPPAGMFCESRNSGAYAVRMLGQSPALQTHWYASTSGDRHHALLVCLKFRGADLRESGIPGVLTDGQFWYSESFLQDGRLISTYSEYLRNTWMPFTSPGVHLIAQANCLRLPAESFQQQSSGWFQKIAERSHDRLHSRPVLHALEPTLTQHESLFSRD
jgi:exosortase/archaeosortase family protein